MCDFGASAITLSTALQAASIASTVIGTGMTVMGQLQQGQAAKAQAEYAANVANVNQQIALNNRALAVRNIEIAQRNQVAAQEAAMREDQIAQQAIERGQYEQSQAALAAKRLIGRQRAVLAANGMDVNSGSALDITGDTAMLGKMDELFILGNAEREASGFRANAGNLRNQAANYGTQAQQFAIEGGNETMRSQMFANEADFSRASGASAQRASYTNAGSSLISGVGSVAQKWYTFTDDYKATRRRAIEDAYFGLDK